MIIVRIRAMASEWSRGHQPTDRDGPGFDHAFDQVVRRARRRPKVFCAFATVVALSFAATGTLLVLSLIDSGSSRPSLSQSFER